MAKKTEKVEECSSNSYLEHPTGEQAHWEQVGAMIGYKSSFPEMLSHSQTRMGRGSPLCEQMCEQIVQQFKGPILCKNHFIKFLGEILGSVAFPPAHKM